MKKDDQIFFSVLLIACSIGIAGLLLVNKYVRSTVIHYLDYCRQTLNAFLSFPTHIIGIVVASLLALMFLAVLLSFTFSLVKMVRRFHSLRDANSRSTRKRVAELAKKFAVRDINIRVVKNHEPLALSLGFFRKTIILSEQLLKSINDKELEAVFLHELAHIKQKHPFKLFLSKIISDLFFFVPIIQELVSLHHSQIELQADNYVLETQKTNRFLKTALTKVVSFPTMPFVASFQSHSLQMRILQLNNFGKQESALNIPIHISKATLIFFLLLLTLFILPSEKMVESLTTFEYRSACEEQHSRTLFSPVTSFSPFK
jgi:beta-lactamase regulating signal transducer with metallopeptidase domain